MLKIRQVRHLARSLGTSEKDLGTTLESSGDLYEELTLVDPAKPEKPRDVINVKGAIRRLQSTFYRRTLLPKLAPSVYSHGGVRGRHIKTNAGAHLQSTFVFKTDIEDFYPSIHYSRVYRLFAGELECSPDVARLCTQLCTYHHHLALGLFTSPILADRLLRPVDTRIAGACKKVGLVYTRFVDDITISGPFDLGESGFGKLVRKIVDEHGFQINPTKSLCGPLATGIPITGLEIRHGHLDVRRSYVRELERQLDDAMSLARGRKFQGPYFTQTQVAGRVRFVCWVSLRRGERMKRKFRSIPWKLVDAEARARSYVATKKVLVRSR